MSHILELSILGCERNKTSRPSNLQNVTRERCSIQVYASMGIMGIPGTGKKTLAHRLVNRSAEVPENVEARLFYLIDFKGIHEPTDIDIFIKVTMFIIPPPVVLVDGCKFGGTSERNPLFKDYWNDFCCLVFIYDVSNQMSFVNIARVLEYWSLVNPAPLPSTRFMLGNKCDLRSEPPGDHEVQEVLARNEALRHGLIYLETSAKHNTDNIHQLYEGILSCAFESHMKQVESQS